MKDRLLNLWKRIKGILLEILYFLASWIFIKNFLLLLAVGGLVISLIFGWLHCYTNHGETVQVHNYEEMYYYDALKMAKKRNFNLIIDDSTEYIKDSALIIKKQNPPPYSRVKKNRNIYLKITKIVPKEVELPKMERGGQDNFVYYSKRLEDLGFEVIVKDSVYNTRMAENTIIEMYFDGENIREKVNEGFNAPEGSLIEFVISKDKSNEADIPDLVCKRMDGVRFILSSSELNLGDVFEDTGVYDPNMAYVYKQTPEFNPNEKIPKGSFVSVYLTQERPPGCPVESSDSSDNNF